MIIPDPVYTRLTNFSEWYVCRSVVWQKTIKKAHTRECTKRFLNESFPFFVPVGTFNGKARRREATPWRTDEIRHGRSERANAEHDESKYERAAKRERRGLQSEQVNEGCHGGYAEITEWKKWPDNKSAKADPRNCKQTSASPTQKEKALCSYVSNKLRRSSELIIEKQRSCKRSLKQGRKELADIKENEKVALTI